MPFKQGHLASRRSDLYSAVLGALVAVYIAVAGYWIVSDIQQQQVTDLRQATERLGNSIARSIAQSVELALGYGIPFDRLYGVLDYLDEVLQTNPELASVVIEDASETGRYALMNETDPVSGSFHEPFEISVWITQNGGRVGQVTVGLTGASGWSVALHQYLLLLAAALLGGLGTTAYIRILLTERWEIPRAHLMASLAANARGIFADFSRIGHESPVTNIYHLAERARAPVRSRAREVTYLAEELRSIDIDGSVTKNVDQALAEVDARYRFERPARFEQDLWWPGWLSLGLLLVGTMTLPLIGSFAADRVGFNLLASSAGALALSLEAIGGLLGLAAAVLWQQRGPPRVAVHLLAVLAAGIATAWTYELRDLTPFLLSRPLSAFAVWFTLFSVMQAPGRSLRAPWYCAFLVIAGMVLGPLLGSLVADGVGRRGAFLVSGILVVLVGIPLCFLTSPARRLRIRIGGLWRQGADVGAAAAATAGIVAFFGGAVIDRHDYALLASFLGMLGIGFALGLILRKPAVTPIMLVVSIGLIWLPYPINVLLFGSLFFLGLAMGLQISVGWRRATGPNGLAAALIGLLIGPLIALGAISLRIEATLWVSLLLAIPLLVSLLGRARSLRRGGAD